MAYTPSFVNFSRYLDANRGAAANTAQGLADEATAQGQGVEDRLNGAVSGFNAQAQVAPNGRDAAGNIQVYRGPSSLAETQGAAYGTLLSDADAAQSHAGDLATESGVRTSLQAKQRAGYTPAASRFDAGLVSAAGQPALSDVASRFSGLSQKIRDANTASGDVATAAKAQSDANEAAYRSQLGNPLASGSAAPVAQNPYTMAKRPTFLPETKVQNTQRALAPAGFGAGATATLNDTLANYNEYRQTAEDAWRRRNYDPLGREHSDKSNPFTVDHVGKRFGPGGFH